MCDSGKAIERKVHCVKETRPDTGSRSFCVWRLDKGSVFSLNELFEGAEIGERVVLEYTEMAEHEVDALPEFEGW